MCETEDGVGRREEAVSTFTKGTYAPKPEAILCRVRWCDDLDSALRAEEHCFYAGGEKSTRRAFLFFRTSLEKMC